MSTENTNGTPKLVVKSWSEFSAEEPELAPYVCATDKPINELLGWGLTRPKTIAEGFPMCSFRFKKGGATNVPVPQSLQEMIRPESI